MCLAFDVELLSTFAFYVLMSSKRFFKLLISFEFLKDGIGSVPFPCVLYGTTFCFCVSKPSSQAIVLWCCTCPQHRDQMLEKTTLVSDAETRLSPCIYIDSQRATTKNAVRTSSATKYACDHGIAPLCDDKHLQSRGSLCLTISHTVMAEGHLKEKFEKESDCDMPPRFNYYWRNYACD